MAGYELWYLDDIGNRLAYVNDVISFDYVKVLGDVGVLSLNIPNRGQVYAGNNPDRRIALYRRPIGGTLSLEIVTLQNFTKLMTTAEGLYQRSIDLADLNDILRRRITAFYAGEAEVLKTDYADDMMKEAVTENLVDNADYSGTPSPARDIDSYGFSVQADASAGPSMTKGFAWRNLLAVLQDIQADSKANGSEVFFGIVPTSETTMQFRTWLQGNDRTSATGTNPIVFSLEWGNLSNPSLSYDYSQSANYVYAGGQGEKTERIIQPASDDDRINISRFGRREAFAHSSGDSDAAVLADARDQLERSRPKINFSADLINTPLTPYGGIQGWNLGDTVTVNYAGLQFDVLIRAVYVQVNEHGDETVKARVEL